MKRLSHLLLLSTALICLPMVAYGQSNTIQLRNGANSTTILPSASTSITVQIPSLTAGTHYLLTSTTNPGSSGAAGSFVTYGNASSQNTTDISATNYLFNVAYSGTTVQEHALGGLISVTATGTNKNATALTLAAAATGSGTSDALYISSGRLKFLESAGATYFTTFKAGDQSADINYTLPTADGTNGQALTTNGSGTLSWTTITAGATNIDGLSDAKSAGTNFTGSLMLGQEPASLGVDALQNTAVGIGALSSLTTGDNNVAVGYNALGSGATSIEAVAIGYNALAAGSGAGRVVAVGPEAGTSCATCAYSVFIGRRAGAATDVVADNTVVGNDAFRMNTSGSDNTVIGANAMENQTQGNFNTAVGRWAGVSNTTGSGSVFLGYNAGPTAAGAINNSLYIHNASSNTPLIKGDFSATTLTFNGSVTTTGTSALNGNVTVGGGASASEVRFLEPSAAGSNYTAFKAQAQTANVTYTLPAADGTGGYYMSTNGSGTLSWAANSLDNLSDAKSGGAQFGSSLILGHQTTGSLTNAEANTAVGYGALESITQGDDNTAIGETALSALTTTERNTAIGAKAMRGATSATWNVFVGAYSGGPFTTNTGDYNVGVGNDVMNVVTSGSNNVAIGYAAGSGLTSGSSNVLIGNSAGSALTTESNRLYISNSSDATPLIYGEFDTDILRFNGRVGIGGAPGATYELDVVGDINYSGAISNTSDARLKRNIQPLVNAMDVVQRLRPVSYDKRENLKSNDYNMKQMGFIAQELEMVLPTSVSTDKSADAVKSVDYISLIPVLTKAMQEQQALIANQQQRLDEQQAEIDELRQLIKRMSVR